MYINGCLTLILMELTRREFLKASGAAAAGLLIKPGMALASGQEDSTSRYFYAGGDAETGLFLGPDTQNLRTNTALLSGQTSLEGILQRGMDAFFQTGAAEIKNGLLLAPWYANSSDPNLKIFDRVTNPSRNHYAVVSDEQSEFTWLVSVGNDPERMSAACKTIEAM